MYKIDARKLYMLVLELIFWGIVPSTKNSSTSTAHKPKPKTIFWHL